MQEAIKLNGIGFYHNMEDIIAMAEKLYKFVKG